MARPKPGIFRIRTESVPLMFPSLPRQAMARQVQADFCLAQ